MFKRNKTGTEPVVVTPRKTKRNLLLIAGGAAMATLSVFKLTQNARK